ncbi:chaperone modulator CbpM [uncultured Mucilaginibacter sp.]|uniref:chaperone modulator CbpM n=1 Tax=uncultured Mucilaginibacter sp. TaxID=797541 RepID=UPI0025CDE6F4|nr:chaperone modulator CbpM [uncultured Mucilaginibacter sp.]
MNPNEMENLIAITTICTYHEVEYTFINSLSEAGLLHLELIDQTSYIPESDLQRLEKMIRLHDELEINVAGIEAITHLLERIEQMQEELRVLKNSIGN